MQTRDMVRMANQIAGFFNGYGSEMAIREAAEHINKFWEPRMRRALFAHVEAGGEGLDATVREALRLGLVKRPKPEVA